MRENECIIDIKNKNDEEILKAYKQIVEETLIAKEIWNKTRNMDVAINEYKMPMNDDERLDVDINE